MADPRESKLPKWVQDELLSLRLKIKDQESALNIANHRAQIGSTGKIIADNLGSDGFPLHDLAQVTFQLPGGKISVMLRENGTLLDINGSQTIQIMPRAANCAFVKLEER